MWMSDQYHAVPQHLTHCPIGRQHNPCNFAKMQFSSRNVYGTRAQIPYDPEDSLRSGVQKCAVSDKAKPAHIFHGGSSQNRAAAYRDRHAEPRRTDAYMSQYDEELKVEPACQQACRSSGSATAAEALMDNVG
jgi:hypothetical protein